MPRRLTAADRQIAALHTAHEAACTARDSALARFYDLSLAPDQEAAAEQALHTAEAAERAAHLDLLAAIDARRDGQLHTTSIAQDRPASNNAQVAA